MKNMLNWDPADLSTQIDPKSNKRSSDWSKNESGNNSSSKEESKGDSCKSEEPKLGNVNWSALNDIWLLLRSALMQQ